jgi:Zn-dependent peptidase ImmA (M78 family)
MFLPFTPNGKATELAAIEIKKELQLGPYEPMDPYAILPRIPARLLGAEVFNAMSLEIRKAMLYDEADNWSGLGYGRSEITGEELILLNPTHHPHRQRASLAEEIVHIVGGHPKSRLNQLADGSWRRTVEEQVEDEAFNVGAACIVPYERLFKAIKNDGRSESEIAELYDVSVEYVRFRIKRAGLYNVYRTRLRSASRN